MSRLIGAVLAVAGVGWLIHSCQPDGQQASTTKQAQDLSRTIETAKRAQAYNSMPTELADGANFGPAPKGVPATVAKAAIDKAGHKCGKVTEATRIPPDGAIIATCANRRRYRVFQARGIGSVAMSCDVAEKQLRVDACTIP